MSLEDTKRVEDISGRTVGDQVNEYLALGWALLTIYIEDRGELGAPSGHPHYVLGWQIPDQEPVFPESVIQRRQNGKT